MSTHTLPEKPSLLLPLPPGALAILKAQLDDEATTAIEVSGPMKAVLREAVAALSEGRRVAFARATDSYSVDEAAKLLDVPSPYVQRKLERGRVPTVIVDEETRVTAEGMEALLEESRILDEIVAAGQVIERYQ